MVRRGSEIRIKKIVCQIIASKIKVRAGVDSCHLLAVHAIEFDFNVPAIVFGRVQHHCMHSNRQVEVEDLEWSVEHISSKVAVKFSSHYIVFKFMNFILLQCDLVVLSQFNR